MKVVDLTNEEFKKVKSIVFWCCVYLICPIDIIPDVIPILGQADDAYIAFAGYKKVMNIIFKHKQI